MARRYAHQVRLIETLRRAGVAVVVLSRPTGGCAEGDLLLRVHGMIAELERAKIVERSRRGHRHATRSCPAGAPCAAPVGYGWVTRLPGGGVARFEAVDEEARIVRQMFAWVGLERVSPHEVCLRPGEAGCRTCIGLTRWGPITIAGMLENPAYIARAAFGRSRFLPAQTARKRAELAGEIEAGEVRLRELQASLAHVDATIRLFAADRPVAQVATKKPQPARPV